RLSFPNTGLRQNPLVLVGRLDGKGLTDARFDEVLYFINTSPDALTLLLPELRGVRYALHPVHLSETAADRRPREHARHHADSGSFEIPGRTALVYVVEGSSCAICFCLSLSHSPGRARPARPRSRRILPLPVKLSPKTCRAACSATPRFPPVMCSRATSTCGCRPAMTTPA